MVRASHGHSNTSLLQLMPACIASLRSARPAGRDALLLELVDALIYEVNHQLGATQHDALLEPFEHFAIAHAANDFARLADILDFEIMPLLRVAEPA